MVSKINAVFDQKLENGSGLGNEVTVYGRVGRDVVDSIDRVADQMLMPRSWVVTQILKEWSERRSASIHSLEESWNGSYREAASGLEDVLDDLARRPATA